MEGEIGGEIKNLDFKWKTKRWFIIVFLFNILIPLLIVLERFMSKNHSIHSSFIIPQILIFPTFLAMSFLAYVYFSKRFAEENEGVIKADRYKYFHWGLLLSFISFCVYVVFLVASAAGNQNVNESWPPIIIFTCLALDCILGTASTTLVTVYEFCVSFDIFYSKNKIDIVKEYLRRTGAALKIEERREINED